jgi:hypothetical protein
MNRIPFIGLFFLILSVTVPVPAHAAWQVFYTGKAQKMFGAHGRGSFATRSQCEAYIRSSSFFERNHSYCSGFDVPAAKAPAQGGAARTGKVATGSQSQQKIELQKKQAEDQSRQQQFDREKNQLLGSLKGSEGNGGLGLKSAGPTGLALKGAGPAKPAASEAWTPEQCRIAQARVTACRAALKQTAEVAERFNKTIAADQALRAEWEKTMSDASERAKNRGQFLWLALPLGKLQRINGVAAEGLEKNGAELADLLAGATDPGKRDQIRIARQFVTREKEIVGNLGKSYENINGALTLGGNAPLMLEDPDESPTSPFQGDAMKLREAGDMLFGLMVERDKWKRIAANAPWAKYLAGGLATAFAAESAARAMFDSWYDAFAAGLAWEQLANMNLNSARYLEAVKKLGAEMRRRQETLQRAEAEFSAQCPKPR